MVELKLGHVIHNIELIYRKHGICASKRVSGSWEVDEIRL